jgi:epoxide hydrolase-like predicted phosphatase
MSMKKVLLLISLLSSSLFAPSPCHTDPEHPKPIIVFDFGGVIAEIDNDALFFYLQRSLNLSPAQATQLLTKLRESRAKGVSEEEFWKEYAASTNTALPANWTESFDAVKQSAVRPIPRMIELVKTLKAQGYRVAMLSNVQKHQAKVVRDKGLHLYFDPLILSCEIGVEKPKMEAFQILVQRLHARPQDCIMIDDTPENIQAARQLGMDVILFQSVEGLQAELKRRNIPDYSQNGREGLTFSIR